MRRSVEGGRLVAVLIGIGGVERALDRAALGAAGDGAPAFQVDPMWPKMPPQWILGQVAGLSVDARDHVWILQRPWSLATDEKAQNPDAACCTPAPPVMEFDAAGNYLQGWGGEGDGLRVAGRRARHPRRLQGQRLDLLGRRTAPARRARRTRS